MTDRNEQDPARVPLWLVLNEVDEADALTIDQHSAPPVAPGSHENAEAHPLGASSPHPQHRSNSAAANLLSAAGHGNAAPVSAEQPWHAPPIPKNTAKPIDSAMNAVAYRRLVRKLVDEASQELTSIVSERKADVASEDAPDTLLPYTKDEEQAKGRDIIADKVKRHIAAGIERGSGAIDPGEEAQLAQDVYNTIFGLGPLQVLVDDPSIENVLLTGTSVLVMYPDGRIQKRPNIFDSDEELIDWLINLGQRADGGGRTFAVNNPHLRLNLPGNIRLSAMAWTVPEPHVAIRLHRLKNITLDTLVGYKVMPDLLSQLLTAMVIGGASIVTSGPMGSGKTTLTRALANALPVETRIGTAETERELFLHDMPGRKGFVVPAEVINGGGERDSTTNEFKGGTDLSAILYAFVRMHLERVIVGEVAGKEIIAMFKAMQMAKGSLSTTHADDAKGAINRLVTVALEAGVTERYAIRQVAAHINLIIQLDTSYSVNDAGERVHTRYISEVIWIEPGEEGMPAVSTVYQGRPGGTGEYGTLPPKLRRKVIEGGFPEHLIPLHSLEFEEGN